MNIVELLDNEILPRVSRGEVFAELNPVDRGDYYVCRCPGCGHESAFAYKHSTYLKCNRGNKCGYGIGMFEYAAGVPHPTGDDWWRALDKLAALAGVQVPDREIDHEQIAAASAARLFLESAWKNSLEEAKAERCQEYLAGRGLLGAELGYMWYANNPFPKDKPVYEQWNDRIIIPIRDRFGNLKGLAGRAVGDAVSKYVYTTGIPLRELGFIGLDVALKHKEQGIIIVEGLLDLIHMRLINVMNVVALGTGGLTKERLQMLVDLGVTKVILALDNDASGKKATRMAIDRAYELLIPPEVLVHEHKLKDADEDIRSGEVLLFPGIQAHAYLAEAFIRDCPSKEQLVDAISRFDECITNKLRAAHMALHFFPRIQEALGFDTDLSELYLARRDANIRKKSNDIVQMAAVRAKKLGHEGKHEEAKEALFSGYQDSEAIVRTSRLAPIRTLGERLHEHELQIEKYRDREILGLRTELRQLTEALLGLRGLMFVAGPPNLGKTILAMELALSVLFCEPEACVVYVNLDMDTRDLMTRIRCNVGGFEWRKYIQGHDIPIDAGRERCESVANRLVILDQECFVGDEQEVLQVIKDLKERTGCSRVLVVLDYLQTWELPSHLRKVLKSENEIDEWRVNVVKQFKRSLGLHDAVLAISEVRKEAYNQPLTMADLKGSSRLSYAGDIILLLQRMTNQEICEWFALDATQYGGIASYSSKRELDMKDQEIKKEAEKIREKLQNMNVGVGWIDIVKGRDGTIHKKIPATLHYKIASIKEGFNIHG